MRCYNGCPDSELKAFLDKQARLRAEIEKLGYSVSYFPNGEFWQLFKDYRPFGEECSSLERAASLLGIS